MKATALLGALAGVSFVGASVAGDGRVLPRPEPAFSGTIGRTWKDSKPAFPAPVRAPAGAPNVLVVLLDDVGFGQASTFGGPVDTPTLDRLAHAGLRYDAFHTTALCSPTRAALLTGRNHHSVGAGVVTELATGYPGYDSILPKSAATIAEILRQNGFATAAFGKWHNTPVWETSTLGPFDRWPTGLGFQYFYGFMAGEIDQFSPGLFENTSPVDPPKTPDQGYHLTTDLADRAIGWLRRQHEIAPEQPFFAYFATGAAHAPHQAPRAWIDEYAGKFDQGWDRLREETFARQKQLGVIPQDAKLTPRPPEIPAWDAQSDDAKRLFARMQQAYAGFLAQTDHEVGRVIDAVAELGELDDTLVFYIVGDNGPSGEGTVQGTLNELASMTGVGEETVASMLAHYDAIGGPATYGHYPVGWAWAGSTPFQWMKQVASHLGGTRDPMVVSWPKRIRDQGGLRAQFHHVIDVAPTILEAAGIAAPDVVNGTPQAPIEGVSMLYTFDAKDAPSRRTTQYFEMFGNRAIYHDGWIAAARHGRVPWDTTGPVSGRFDDDRWELYDLRNDYSEADDLAAKEPDRLRELQSLFTKEAEAHHVFPLDDRTAMRLAAGRPGADAARREVTYWPGAIRIPASSAPKLLNRSFAIEATLDVADRGSPGGVIVTDGGRFGGFALYVAADGRPTFAYNWGSSERYTIAASAPLAPGKHTVRFEFAYDGGKPGSGGTGTIAVDGAGVARGRIDKTMPLAFSVSETFDVGRDTGTAAGDYEPPFALTGLGKVTFEVE